jgi:hypothetical protein
MLGSNPSADSAASTDSGGCDSIPLFAVGSQHSDRERRQSVKSWGFGGKAPAILRWHPSFLLMLGRPLIMHRKRLGKTSLE